MKGLIKQILENHGLNPEEIEAVLKTMRQNSADNQSKNKEQLINPQAVGSDEDSEKVDLSGLPEDLRLALEGLTLKEQRSIVRLYNEEQENAKCINSLLEKEEEEKKELYNRTEKASEEYIIKHLAAENNDNERVERDNIDFISELMARELEEEEKREHERHKGDKESEDYIKKLLEEEKKQEEDSLPVITCAICLDDLFSQSVFPLYNCGHLYHIECLENYVIEEIKKRAFPIRCPHPECKKEIPEHDVKDTLQANLQYQDIYDEYYIKSYVESNPNDFIHCPTPDCGSIYCTTDNPRFDCPKCKKSHCMKCETEWHQNIDCQEYQRQKRDQRDNAFIQFAERMNYMRCPKCRVFVERSEGCNAMQCSRCHTNFCYECGREGDGHHCNHDGRIIRPRPQRQEQVPRILRKKKWK